MSVKVAALVGVFIAGVLVAEPLVAQTTGTCDTGTASAELDFNNVRASLFNSGNLFYSGDPPVDGLYEVPKGSGNHSVFGATIWVGGRVNGEIRAAAATYHNYEFWPGPLDEQGNPPEDCAVYDRIWRVSVADVHDYNENGVATDDLRDWPHELGAPVADGDGIPDNYDLAAGDRPEIIGDQTAWWVMNDAGNVHEDTESEPLGLEVRVAAFAMRSDDAVDDATFYRYELVYKGAEPLTDAYFGIWNDPDLGNSGDDYIGSDTTRGLGFVYNGRETDASYGVPPALGYDFLQGPLVDNDSVDNDGDGEADEEGERVQMATFGRYNSVPGVTGRPIEKEEFHGYLRGVWKDGTPFTIGTDGYGDDLGLGPTRYMFPGDPPEFWSEFDTDGQGAYTAPYDVIFFMSTGPFAMQPGDVQEIVVAAVWAQGAGHLASVEALRQADDVVQQAFDEGLPVLEGVQSPGGNEASRPGNVILEGGAPNPFREATTLRYGLPVTADVVLTVYDVLGRRVATLAEHRQDEGWHEVPWEPGDLASGVYVVRLSADGVVRTSTVVRMQ